MHKDTEAEMCKTPDHYATLGIPNDAAQQQISRAYRALMRSHHPDMERSRENVSVQAAGKDAGADQDKGGADSGAELLRIMEAFEVLRDPVRRAAYDRGAAHERAAHEGAAAERAAADRRRGAGATSEPETSAGRSASANQESAPRNIPVRTIRRPFGPLGETIRITPVRWESGPYA